MDFNSCYEGTLGLRDLALYSHAVPALAILVLGIFAFAYAMNRAKAAAFFAFSLTFAAWLSADLVNWMANNYQLVAATWAPLDYIEIAFFLLLLHFTIIDLLPDVPTRYRWLIIAPAIVPLFITLSGNAVYDFNQPQCEMVGNEWYAQYKLILETLIIAIVAFAGIYRLRVVWADKAERIRSAMVAGAIGLFMAVFAGAEFYSTQTNIFEVTLYSLFVLPLFILVLTIAITNYGTFRLGDATIKVLFYIFLLLAGTQFFFVQSMGDFALAAMSFSVVLILGLVLYRTSERETAARHTVEKLSAEKSEFMAFASHEIRNPITAMRGYASMISDGTLGAADREVMRAARQVLLVGDEVLMLISQFLDKSKVELGQIEYHLNDFDAGAAAKSIADGYRPHVEEKGLVLVTDIDLSKNLTVHGDEAKLKEIIGNIIDNSLKYTPKGSITISAYSTEDTVRIIVQDTGVGIPQEVLPKLFRKFGREDAAKANLLGTGLGLYIAKVFIEGMGGRIGADSDGKDKGARFIIELPRA